MAAHIKKIHAANEGLGIRVLAGAEIDILKDGSHFNIDRAAMTERMLAAIENPFTQIIAHPTGRLLLWRDPIDYEMEKVLEACAKHGVAMECNWYPDRLDLKDVYLRMCKEHGVKVVISTDSHTTQAILASSATASPWPAEGGSRRRGRHQYPASRRVPRLPPRQARQRQQETRCKSEPLGVQDREGHRLSVVTFTNIEFDKVLCGKMGAPRVRVQSSRATRLLWFGLAPLSYKCTN